MAEALILDYELTLLKDNTDLSLVYFRGNDARKWNVVCSLIKYAMSGIMHLSDEDASRILTFDLLEKLKIMPYIEQHLSFPSGLDDEQRRQYLIHKVYPKYMPFDYDKMVIDIYLNVSSPDRKRRKYPKDFFAGFTGQRNACIILRYLINKYLVTGEVDKTKRPESIVIDASKIDTKTDLINSLYDFFGNKAKAEPFLRKANMLVICKNNFNTPIDFFHQSLSDKEKNEFLYQYYLFKNTLPERRKLYKKRHGEISEVDKIYGAIEEKRKRVH